MTYTDLTGQVFNKLTVLEYAGKVERNRALWKCICECGRFKIIRASSLVNGDTKSCGCLKVGKKPIHGGSRTSLYSVWQDMKNRCKNPKEKHYKHYGGRGIKVCYEWENFCVFQNWSLENGYRKPLSIDRIDNDGDYSPLNCKWSTQLEQQYNKSNTIFYTINGEKLTAIEIEEKYKIPKRIFTTRLWKGWAADKLFQPVKYRPKGIKNNLQKCQKNSLNIASETR